MPITFLVLGVGGWVSLLKGGNVGYKGIREGVFLRKVLGSDRGGVA